MKCLNKLLNRLSTASFGATLALITSVSILLNITLEALGRHSILLALEYLAKHPVMFLYNSLIILFTLSCCLIVKRRATMLFILTAIWLGLGITNCILLGYRSSPLSAIDFTIVKSAIGLFTLYLSIWQIVLIAAALIAVAVLVVVLHIKCPRCRVSYKKSLLCVVLLGLSVFSINPFAQKINAIDYTVGELADAYDSYGFAYCFTMSLVSQGVKRPEDYSDDKLDELKKALSDETVPPDLETVPPELEPEPIEYKSPNIIFVQLESFFDIRRINWLDTSEEVTPNFNYLKDNGISGYLKMENIGGGTANSEFEVLTGMNLDHFGFGEYPYTTILQSKSCESIANDLKALGYGTHALHNHTATFYDRHKVYSSLGFDTFTPAEMMTELTYNPLGWERDAVLTDEIISALDTTEGSDFVFAVTVQGHGKYPEELPDSDDSYPSYELEADLDAPIIISGTDDPQKLAQYSYYANQLRETDDFIGELIAALEARDEAFIVVFYGDHLPALSITDEELEGDLFDTDYAVWSNIDLGEETGRDLEAYRLYSYILSLCKISYGDITKLHQYELSNDIDLDDELHLLEYSQLYDPDEPSAFEPTDMTFGTHPRSIKSFERIGNSLYIFGSGFTESCAVEIGGFTRTAELVSSELIIVENVYFSDPPERILWLASDGTELAYLDF